jgi:type II secretory pathway predicted ATPase ExeA
MSATDPGGTNSQRRLRPSRGHGDAFGETSNPADYVAREASDLALSKLEWCVSAGQPAALVGPPGLGKTLLLRLLVERTAPKLRSMFLPYGALDLRELCAWALGLLDEPASDAPLQALVWLARSRARDGSGLLLLIDDASAMPIATARGLGEAIVHAEGGLRVVLAAADDAAASRVVAAMHPDTLEVRLSEVMTLAETQRYLHGRLELRRAPAIAKARFDAPTVERIHRLSGGVPRRIHDLAVTLLGDVPSGVSSTSGDDRWLGAPLDDLDADAKSSSDPFDDDLEPRPSASEASNGARPDDLSFFRRLLSRDS